MDRIPPITPHKPLRKARLLAFQRHVTTAHDALSQVVKAVVEMPSTLVWEFVELVGGVRCDDADDGVEAV